MVNLKEMIGMKNKKERKWIDIERLVYKIGIISNLLLCIPIILNAMFWHYSFLSGITTGFNLCLIVMFIFVGIAGNNNFKYTMAEFDRRFNEIKKQSEEALKVLKEGGEKDAKKKLQSGRGQNTTNDNEEA